MKPEREDVDPLLTAHDVARVLSVCTMTVYRLVEAGELRGLRVGTQHRFRREDLDDYLRRAVVDV